MAAASLVAAIAAWLWLAMPAVAAPSRPDIILIQTDDQPRATIHERYRGRDGRLHWVMPNLRRLMLKGGVEFRDYYASNPVCGPSRATLLSGQYSHNNGVTRNGGSGGWNGFQRLPIMNHNMATSLQGAGYRTVHFGKFLNYYDDEAAPPGWDRWVSDYGDASTRFYYGYRQTDDGVVKGPYGTRHYRSPEDKDRPNCRDFGRHVCAYHSDRVTDLALDELDRPTRKPLYMQLDFHAPHSDGVPTQGPEPAARHLGSASRTRLHRSPSFNERDLSDKPPAIRRHRPRLDRHRVENLTHLHRRILESLRAVDDSLGEIAQALWAEGRLDDTYLVFTSDNGLMQGEHRVPRSKFFAYEESVAVPLLIRGPGIRAGSRTPRLASNIDLAPTILGMAGSKAQENFDGRNLRSAWLRPRGYGYRGILLDSAAMLHMDKVIRQTRRPDPGAAGRPPRPARPRKGGGHGAGVSAPAPPVNAHVPWRGVRVGPYKYVFYARQMGEELYDLRNDPRELRNRARDPRYSSVLEYMAEQMMRLEKCSGAACRAPVPTWPQPQVTG